MNEAIAVKTTLFWHRRSFRLGMVLALLFIVLIAFFWWWMQQKSVGTTQVVLPPEVKESSRDGSKTLFQGQYLTFSYPSSFELRQSGQQLAYPVLERVMLSRNDIEGRKIVALVQDIDTSTIEEYPHYRMRTLDPEIYKRERVILDEKSYTFFSKDTGVFEVGAFWQVDNLAVSLVVSSPTKYTGLREELESLLGEVEVSKNQK